MKGIGYREWQPYFEGVCSEEKVKAEIQKHSRQFAKRQYTWLNHQMPVEWTDMSDSRQVEQAVSKTENWYTKATK